MKLKEIAKEKDKQENTEKDFWGEQHKKTIVNQITLGIYDDWYKPVRGYNYNLEN